MKIAILCVLFIACTSTSMYAQESSRVTIEDKQDMQSALKNQVYRFPSFLTGKVYLVNGNYNTAKLNLNLLTDQIQFIDEKQDTLTILSPDFLAYIAIDSSKFIHHDNKYLEVLDEYNTVMLAVNRKLKIADLQRTGAYGAKTSSASIANISTGYTDKLRYTPTVTEDMLVNSVQAFYLIDHRKNVRPVNRRNVLRAFPSHQNEITAYMKEHKPNFKNEQAVRALLNYASNL